MVSKWDEPSRMCEECLFALPVTEFSQDNRYCTACWEHGYGHGCGRPMRDVVTDRKAMGLEL